MSRLTCSSVQTAETKTTKFGKYFCLKPPEVFQNSTPKGVKGGKM